MVAGNDCCMRRTEASQSGVQEMGDDVVGQGRRTDVVRWSCADDSDLDSVTEHAVQEINP